MEANSKNYLHTSNIPKSEIPENEKCGECKTKPYLLYLSPPPYKMISRHLAIRKVLGIYSFYYLDNQTVLCTHNCTKSCFLIIVTIKIHYFDCSTYS